MTSKTLRALSAATEQYNNPSALAETSSMEPKRDKDQLLKIFENNKKKESLWK